MSYKRIRYEVDPHNRLVAARSKKESEIPKYRQVLEGKFKIDKNNFLIYHIKKSRDYEIPQQIKLSGNWSLDRDHNLVLTLDKWNNQCEGNRLIIKGDIIDVKSNELAFAIITKNSSGQGQLYILKITGFWQVDEYNRLAFNVEKENGEVDGLTLEGLWEVNKQNQIIYTYTKTDLKRKEKIIQTLTFKGYWDVTEKYRISYILNKGLSSQFDFKTGFSKSVKNTLQYKVNIGIVPKNKIITLLGTWKLNKRLGVLFEMEYTNNKVQGIIFGASCKLSENEELNLKLRNRLNEDLGIEVKLSRDILVEQGQAFIEALSSRKETAIFAGAGFRW